MGLTCVVCGGEVNVSMHNGATLRCPCGKMSMPATFAQPTAPEPAERIDLYVDLLDLLKMMREHKVLRVTTPVYTVELSPEAFAPEWPAQTSSLGNVEEKLCRCGHSIPVQHNPEGECLEGCEPDACAEKAAA